MALRVLYLHPVGAFGGSSRSLIELIEGFPPGEVLPCVITQRGSASEHFALAGAAVMSVMGITQFDNTRYGHYRGLRWLVLLREIAYAPVTLLAILAARRRWPQIDIIHVNEIVALLPIALAKKLIRKPLVVHVRSVQREDTGRVRDRLVKWVLAHFADAVIAIDETVKRSLPEGTACDVIHNGFRPGALLSARAPPEGRLRIGMVGNLLPMKGVHDFLAAARICKDRRLNVEFLIVGSNPRNLSGPGGWLLRTAGFARDVERDVLEFLSTHDLRDQVRLLPFTKDIDRVYRALDVVCFPSHLDAVGRPVIEAAFFKIPSIVAATDPAPDTLIPGETGLCVPARDPTRLADAIEFLSLHPAELARMGEAAYMLAMRNFDSKRNAARVLSLYQRIRRGPRPHN